MNTGALLRPHTRILLRLCGCLLFTLAGCSSTHYSLFEGGGVVEGTGGTRKSVEGIDVWTYGTPPRKYKIIGMIDDVRRQDFIGMIGYEKKLARIAKDEGGDGILFMDVQNKVVGFYNSGTMENAQTTGSATTSGNSATYKTQTTYYSSGSTTTAISDRISKVAVIKYVDQ